MTVSLNEIFAAARAHAAPLAAESAGYLLLAVADHVVSAPRVIDAEEVELGADGSVRLRARRGAALAGEGAEQRVRQLLARALELSSSVGPALRRAAERREETGLVALVRELEVALIPVNRSAAKRALSRLHRETERARDAGKLEAWLRAEVVASAVAPTAPSSQQPVAAPVPPPVLVAAPPASPVVETPTDFASSAEPSEPMPMALPLVETALARPPLPAPPVELTLTPEPRLAVGEPALTKPEPVIARAKERGSWTPRLGTLVTAQTLPGEELERTERAPSVAVELEAEAASENEQLDLAIDVELEELVEAHEVLAVDAPAPAEEPQPLLDPEPSRLPDVLTAMLELHTGIEADDAPTRICGVVTELAPDVPVDVSPVLTPEPEQVDDAWLTASSLEGLVTAPVLFVSEQAAPEVHEALTWNPGPVVTAADSELPAHLLLAEPVLEPSPYAPAVLPARSSDVSELLDSFYVSGAAEERELCTALKEMAGVELTPPPRTALQER